MRKYFCAICIIAFATCCSKKNNIDKASSDVAILTSFAERPLTKTTINGNEVSGFTSTWSYTDAIGVYTTEGTSNALHSISIQPDGSAVFRGAIKASAVEQTLYSYYPHCTDATSNASAVFFNLPNEQKMEGDSYDHTAALMIGKPQTAIISGETGEIGNWQFAHINAYIRVNVANITVEGVSQNEKVSSVEIRSVGKALSGSMKINLTNKCPKKLIS